MDDARRRRPVQPPPAWRAADLARRADQDQVVAVTGAAGLLALSAVLRAAQGVQVAGALNIVHRRAFPLRLTQVGFPT